MTTRIMPISCGCKIKLTSDISPTYNYDMYHATTMSGVELILSQSKNIICDEHKDLLIRDMVKDWKSGKWLERYESSMHTKLTDTEKRTIHDSFYIRLAELKGISICDVEKLINDVS